MVQKVISKGFRKIRKGVGSQGPLSVQRPEAVTWDLRSLLVTQSRASRTGKRLAHRRPSFQPGKESSYPPCISQSTWEEGSPAWQNQGLAPTLDPAAFPSAWEGTRGFLSGLGPSWMEVGVQGLLLHTGRRKTEARALAPAPAPAQAPAQAPAAHLPGAPTPHRPRLWGGLAPCTNPAARARTAPSCTRRSRARSGFSRAPSWAVRRAAWSSRGAAAST